MNRTNVATLHLTRIAGLLRELANELESRVDGMLPANAAPRVKPGRKRVHRPFTPQRELSELEIARARQRARKLGIPIP
jgi:hypothetical protein